MGESATFVADQHGKIASGTKSVEIASAREIVEGNNARMPRLNFAAGDRIEGMFCRFLIVEISVQTLCVAETADCTEHRRGVVHGESISEVFDPITDERDGEIRFQQRCLSP